MQKGRNLVVDASRKDDEQILQEIMVSSHEPFSSQEEREHSCPRLLGVLLPAEQTDVQFPASVRTKKQK